MLGPLANDFKEVEFLADKSFEVGNSLMQIIYLIASKELMMEVPHFKDFSSILPKQRMRSLKIQC